MHAKSIFSAGKDGMADWPRYFCDDEVMRAISSDEMLAEIARAYSSRVAAGPRAIAELNSEHETFTTLAMPALDDDGISVVKIVSMRRGERNSLNAQVAVLDATGALVAILEAHALTSLRTAAASVHAAQVLGVSGGNLLVLGAGRQAEAHARAYCGAMEIDRLTIWARREDAAAELASRLTEISCNVETTREREVAIAGADIISAATASQEPLVLGACVRPGAHVDLVGSFRPDMREGDNELMSVGTVFVDTPNAINETGDLIDPISAGVLIPSQIRSISDVLSNKFAREANAVTVFKSVGHAALDSVAARLACEKLGVGLQGLKP